MRDEFRWLHLSDNHAAVSQHFEQARLFDYMVADLERRGARGWHPDVVFVSGDLAYSGKVEEYRIVLSNLTQLAESIGLPPSRFVMCPGNHDVDRRKASDGYTRPILHQQLRSNPHGLSELLDAPQEMAQIWTKLEAYAEFAEPYAAPKLTPEQPFWAVECNITSCRATIVGLNTALLCFDADDSPNNLVLGARQLQRAVDEQPKEHLLIVLMHHPPQWLKDGSRLETILQDRPHLLFCGHVHKQGGLVSSPLHGHGLLRLVAGAGHADPQSPAEHGYSWGYLATNGLYYFPRTWVEQQNCFMPDRNTFKDIRPDESVHVSQDKLPQALRNWLSNFGPAQTNPANQIVNPQ